MQNLGRGVATIHIEFPEAVEGSFEVSLRRQSSRRASVRSGGQKPVPARTPSRYTRPGVKRETQFDELAAGIWYVSVDGFVRAPRSGSELANFQEEIEFVAEEEFEESDLDMEVRGAANLLCKYVLGRRCAVPNYYFQLKEFIETFSLVA